MPPIGLSIGASLRRVAVAFAVLLVALGHAVTPAGAGGSMAQLEQDVIELHNRARADRGLAPLTVHPDLTDAAREWAEVMAADGQTRHRSEFWAHSCDRTGSWQGCAENVAGGFGTAQSVHDAWMASSGHRASILNGAYNRVGIGVWAEDDGRLQWVAYFMDGTTAVTGQAPAHAQDECPPTGAYDPDGPSGTVYRLYRAYFLRDPDLSGYEYWLCQFHRGTPATEIADAFAASEEYRARYGSSSNVEYVDLVYANVLGRPGDESGRQYWIDQLASGTTRGAVMIAFSDSAEFRSVTADGRPPAA